MHKDILPFEQNQVLFDTLTEIENQKISQTAKENIRKFVKSIYDFTKLEEKENNASDTLRKLIISQFDNEQIWQQLELQNVEVLNRNSSKLDELLSVELNDELKSEEDECDNTVKSDQDESSEDSEQSDIDEEGMFDEVDEEQSECNLSEDESNQNKSNDSKPVKSYKNTVVDDEFFKLQEMEEFLNSVEKEESNDKEENSDDEDENEPIDYFAEESDDEENTKAITAKFKDFFRKNEEDQKPSKNGLSDNSENEEGDPSTFELREQRLRKRIEDIETKAVSDKPWTLKGEIKAADRPINSLLEEDIEFDRSARPAPIVTGQTTVQLEDIIKQRIKDRAFDSVQKKDIAVEEPFEYKKKLTISQEKSKESLAQIYEREYLEEKAALDPDNNEKGEEEPELHKEIKKSMRELFDQLDALSNYHFTPKPAIPELKIVSNTPALYTEEVGPVAISDAPLLAPEEVKSKTKGDILGKTERTSTDKKRERRKKKAKQRYHAKLQEKKANEANPNKNMKKGKEAEALKILSRDSNIKQVVQGKDIVKSSKSFFEQLENKQQISNNNNKRKQNSDERNVKRKKM